MPEIPQVEQSQSVAFVSRFYGAFWGMFIGDALGIATHGYTNRSRLSQDYGWVNDFVAPKNPHPESKLFRTSFDLIPGKNDILHQRVKEWKTPGIHFHQHLLPGDNTLNALLAIELTESLTQNSAYHYDTYIGRFLDFMLSEGRHDDTYISDAILRFFENYGRGRDLSRCAEESTSLEGIVTAMPLILFYWNDVSNAKTMLRKHLAIAHKGESIARSGDLVAEILIHLLNGHDFEDCLFNRIKSNQNHPALNFPYRRWRDNHDDEEVVSSFLKTGRHINDALPLVIYLVLKYQNDLEQALVVNTNLGGETCARGALIGAFMGAIHGSEELPARWVSSLENYAKLDALCDGVAAAVLS